MPWTFAHPAAVLPLRSVRWLPFGSLVVGSLSPDAGYYVGAFAVAEKAHTLPGAIVICLPTAIVVEVILRVLHKPVAGLLPYPHRQIALSLPTFRCPSSALAAGYVCLAMFIGAITHIVWDAFTHPAGYFVAKIPALRTVSFAVGGRAFPLFEVMQHASTAVGVIVLGVAYRHVSRQVVRGSLGPPESDVWRYVLLGTGAVVSMAGAVPIAYFGATHGQGINMTLLAVRFAMASSTVFAVLLAIASLVVARRCDDVSRHEREV